MASSSDYLLDLDDIDPFNSVSVLVHNTLTTFVTNTNTDMDIHYIYTTNTNTNYNANFNTNTNTNTDTKYWTITDNITNTNTNTNTNTKTNTKTNTDTKTWARTWTNNITDTKTDTKTDYRYDVSVVHHYTAARTNTHNYETDNQTTNHTYAIRYYVYSVSPLVLDLDDNRRIDVAEGYWLPHAPKFYMKYTNFFDLTGDGIEDFCEWMSPRAHDGLLCMPDENGQVRNALQLFGTAGGFLNGFEKLSLVCDKDNNGWIEGSELKGLKIWIDKNNDGKCESNEIFGLDTYGITRIATRQKNYVGAFVTSDEKYHVMWDWWPSMTETRKFKR
jgi:hypothetical protein